MADASSTGPRRTSVTSGEATVRVGSDMATPRRRLPTSRARTRPLIPDPALLRRIPPDALSTGGLPPAAPQAGRLRMHERLAPVVQASFATQASRTPQDPSCLAGR